MTKYINFVEKFTGKNKDKFLGRWQITYCENTLNKRVDLANEDHCGVCYSTKYHNNAYITHMNNITNAEPVNNVNFQRHNRYIQIMNAIKRNKDIRDAKKKITDATNTVNKNAIIDLE